MALKHPPHRKFKGHLVSEGIRQKEVARLLGITHATFSKKINIAACYPPASGIGQLLTRLVLFLFNPM